MKKEISKNINLNTFKKLLSIKKGGAELFRLFIKTLVWIFVLSAIFYGLIWTPNQLLNIEVVKINIETAKVARGCLAATDQAAIDAIKQSQKLQQSITKQAVESFRLQQYNDCVTLQARDNLKVKSLRALPIDYSIFKNKKVTKTKKIEVKKTTNEKK